MGNKRVDENKNTEKKEIKKRHFWSDGLSIDESKLSVLVVMALIGFFYSLFSHYSTGDITNNLLQLIEILILSIVGTNVAGYVAGAIQGRRDKKDKGDYNRDVRNIKDFHDDENY